METKEKNIKEEQTSNAQKESESSKKSGEGSDTAPYLEINEDRLPEFRDGMRKHFPDLTDADMPFERRITNDYFGRIEKKRGHSISKLREAASPFYTWKA